MQLRPDMQTPRVLWGALLASTLFFPVIATRVAHRPAAPPEPVLLYAIYGVAAAVAVASFVLPRTIYRSAARQALRQLSGDRSFGTGPSSEAQGFRGAAAATDVFADPRAALARAERAYRTYLILGCALSENLSIDAFILAVAGFPLAYWAPLSALGTLLLAARFPTEDGVFDLFEEATGTRFPPGARGR